MNEYIVRVKEIWFNEVAVQADSIEDALESAQAGNGEYLSSLEGAQTGHFDGLFGYVDTMDKEVYDVYLDGKLVY